MLDSFHKVFGVEGFLIGLKGFSETKFVLFSVFSESVFMCSIKKE